MAVRVVNPATGHEIHPNAVVTVVDRADGDGWPDRTVVVRVVPSFRPGAPYDLCGYPPEWVVTNA